jgi:hypothetical protein
MRGAVKMTRLGLGFPPRDMVIKSRLFWKQETIARFQFEATGEGDNDTSAKPAGKASPSGEGPQ